MKRALIFIILILFLPAGIVYAQESGTRPGSQSSTVRSITLPIIHTELKEGEGRINVETLCAICHGTDYIPLQPKFPKAQWTATVNKMIKTFGAPITPEDAEKIINYLSVNYGTGN